MIFISLTCKECGQKFDMSFGEIDFYKKNGLSHPKRCKACRRKADNDLSQLTKHMALKSSNLQEYEKIYGKCESVYKAYWSKEMWDHYIGISKEKSHER